ncbi:MAG: M1 family metallopeptidase [Bacteroidota bacterium]
MNSRPIMRALYLILGTIFCCTFFFSTRVVRAQQATTSDTPLSNRLVSYQMDVTLNPEERSIAGTQRVTWRNPDAVPVDELQFHLYLNAFKNEQSTFMVESGGSHRGFTPDGENPWGGIEINQMEIVQRGLTDAAVLEGNASVDLTSAMRFIQPDDDNEADQTVISVPLPAPVAPGETITLDIDFTSQMPQIFARTGWERKDNDSLFFMVVQWFPKLGVYEIPGQRYVPDDASRGKWSTHQFHANSEFYADFGTYDVTITTPATYEVGASGVLIDETIASGQRTVTYKAEDVHDFAWTASGDYLVFEDSWNHVSLRLMLQPEHRGQVERHFDAAKISLEYFEKWVGPYPYTTLTLVDGIGGSNGMEYPTLITCGTAYLLPEWVRLLELVTIHEFGHQYFYGMLASNEAEEAWLDEGLNSYIEMRIMDEVYGNGGVIDFPWLKVADRDVQRLSYIANRPERGPIYKRSWEYEFRSDYGKASYAKPAIVMKTLENYLGWDVMEEVMKTYYNAWRFRHPTTEDFIDVVEKVSGQSLDWFFRQYVYGTEVVDYKVADITVVPDEVSDTVVNQVHLTRDADGVFPQEIEVVFDNGVVETVEWSGEELEKTITFARPAAIEEVHLDPDNKVLLDINQLDNRLRVNPESRFARLQTANVIVWLQQLFNVAGALF